MNIGIILAAGKGARMGTTDRPKQFVEIHCKPIVVYTIQAFNTHPDIDYIAIVCLKEWFKTMNKWVEEYQLDKVKWIFEGGQTRQESTYAGLIGISHDLSYDDIVVIHDAVRPLVSNRYPRLYRRGT